VRQLVRATCLQSVMVGRAQTHTANLLMQDGPPPTSLQADPFAVALHTVLRPAAAPIRSSCRAPCRVCRVALNATTARPMTTVTTIGIQNASTTDTTTDTATHTSIAAATASTMIAIPNGVTTDTTMATLNPPAARGATAILLHRPTQMTLFTLGGAHTRHPLAAAAPVLASRTPATTRRKIQNSTTWAKHPSLLA
jgi:hypothetical protein